VGRGGAAAPAQTFGADANGKIFDSKKGPITVNLAHSGSVGVSWTNPVGKGCVAFKDTATGLTNNAPGSPTPVSFNFENKGPAGCVGSIEIDVRDASCFHRAAPRSLIRPAAQLPRQGHQVRALLRQGQVRGEWRALS
jgi:hypothetical protein